MEEPGKTWILLRHQPAPGPQGHAQAQHFQPGQSGVGLQDQPVVSRPQYDPVKIHPPQDSGRTGMENCGNLPPYSQYS